MSLTYADFQKYNAFRRPSWRWERVLQLCDRYPTPGRCSRRDDDFVRKARNFLLRWKGAKFDRVREELFQEEPGLFYAHDIYEKSHDDPEPRAFLEARLVARQDKSTIADAIGTSEDAVVWFEALYFNVLDRLNNRDWITKHVLMPAIRSGNVFGNMSNSVASIFRDSTVAQPFMDGTLKLFAYFGGTHMVDMLIAGVQSGKPLASPDDLATWVDSHWSATIRKRSLQASATFEVNKYNVMELFAVHTKIMEIEKSDESQEAQRTTIERHIKAMIDDLPWAVGDQGAQALNGTALGEFDTMAAELRDDEILQVSAGEVPAGLVDELFPMKLPEPRKRKSLNKPKEGGPQ